MPSSRPMLFLALAAGLLCGPAAAQGVRFTNAFVTTPICAASRASVLTGAWESAHGYTFGTPLLREAGYRTGFLGKFGVRVPDGASARMFDVFRPMGQPFVQETADGQSVHLSDRTRDEALAFLRGCDADKDNQYPCAPTEAGLYADAPVPAPLVPECFRDGLPEFLAESETLGFADNTVVLEYARVAAPASFRGRSLVPWVRGDVAVDWRVDFHAEHRMKHAKVPEWEGADETLEQMRGRCEELRP